MPQSVIVKPITYNMEGAYRKLSLVEFAAEFDEYLGNPQPLIEYVRNSKK